MRGRNRVAVSSTPGNAAFVSVGLFPSRDTLTSHSDRGCLGSTICSTTGRSLTPRTRQRPRCSQAEFGEGAKGTPAIDKRDGENVLHVVFVHPQIHWNTGNIGRTCMGLGATLHLVGPLGFSLDEKQVRRAGLDYWEHVDVNVYDSWEQFANGRMQELGGTRFFFTKFGAECATSIRWPTDGKIVMIFGSELDGFDGIRGWLDAHGSSERKVAFPMVDGRFRSFNLSTTASMALWDAYKEVKMREKLAP